MSNKNKELLEVMDKSVAVIPVMDGWIFKFDSNTLSDLLDKAIDSGENAAVVFVKTPSGN